MIGSMDPRRPCEVVNAAMTAINSPILLDIARDLRACRPDVVVLYIGNNEVVGPFGPGTIFSPLAGAARLAAFRVRLTRLRLVQLLSFRRSRTPRTWAGLDMFAGFHFPEGDPRLEPMYAAYRRNLESIVDACRESGARVILSTVAVNPADCPPFGSEPPDALPPAVRGQWQAAFDDGLAAQRKGDSEQARAGFRNALALADRHADLVFRLAQAERAAGNPPEARRLFRRARDLDTQRFRADRRINDIIRDVARNMEVQLVDAEAAFDAASPASGVPGDELFLDHVHFTFQGTWHLAALFANAILGTDAGETPSPETCRHLMFFNPWAEAQQASLMRKRRGQPPSLAQSGNDRQIARFYEIEARCAARMAETPLPDLEREFLLLSAAAPRDFFLPFQWGAILASRRRWTEALPLLTTALRQVPRHFEARVLPALALCHAGQPAEAARLVLGPPGPHGRYLAENALSVMRSLEGDGLLDEARLFRTELLRLAPRFPLRPAIASYPLGKSDG